MTVKTILFWGGDESDTGRWLAVTVNGSAQFVVKGLTAKGVNLNKVPKAIYEYKRARNGTVEVICEKGADVRIRCAVGWIKPA